MEYSKIENDVFEYINKIRKNPELVIHELKDKLKYFSGKIYKDPDNNINIITTEGVEAVEECIAFFNNLESINPFESSVGLKKAAKDHCEDIGIKGLNSHLGTDGSEVNDRIEKYGEWNKGIAENISFGESTGREIILQLLIDDGIKNRGHRKNLLSKDFKYIGIACGYHKIYEHLCVMNFSTEYKEKNENNKNTNFQTPKPIEEPNFDDEIKKIEEDEEWPENAIKCQVKKQTKVNGNKKIVKITKIFKLNDGTEEIIENTIEQKIN